MLGSNNLQQLLMAELATLDASLKTESLIYIVLGTCLALLWPFPAQIPISYASSLSLDMKGTSARPQAVSHAHGFDRHCLVPWTVVESKFDATSTALEQPIASQRSSITLVYVPVMVLWGLIIAGS